MKVAHIADVFTSGISKRPAYRIPFFAGPGQHMNAVCERRLAGKFDDGGTIELVARNVYTNVETVLVRRAGASVANPQAYVDEKVTLLLYTTADHDFREAMAVEGKCRRSVFLGERDITDLAYDGMVHVNPCAGGMLRLSTGRIVSAFSGTDAVSRPKKGAGVWERIHLAPWRCFLLLSDDDGKTWQRGLTGPLGTNEVALCETDSGVLYMNARDLHNEGGRWSGVSVDGGKTADWWQNDDLFGTDCHAGVAHRDGRLFYTCPRGPDIEKRRNLVLRESLDMGMTWRDVGSVYKKGAGYSALRFVDDKLLCLFERDGYAGISLAVLEVDGC